MPIHQVGKLMGIEDRKPWHMIDCYVEKGLYDADHSLITRLGMDETGMITLPCWPPASKPPTLPVEVN